MAALRNFLKRRPDSHKGDYGRLLVIAGSRAMSGAAYLASMSALRSGCGLVYLALPKSIHTIIARQAIEVVIRPLPETKAGSLAASALAPIRVLLKGIDAVCLGPGLSMHVSTRKLVRALLGQISCPLIMDADGLNCIAGASQLLKKCRGSVVVTPHPGELARLTGMSTRRINAEREQAARQFAKKYGVITLLKGHRTVIAAPSGKHRMNHTGNPGMATAGSGDVLSGILGAFLARGATEPGYPHSVRVGEEVPKRAARGATPFEAAQWAAHVHGLAGDRAARKKSQTSMVARDILESLPAVFKSLEK